MAKKIKKMRSQGLARRWATNILSVTAAILVVVESVFIFVVHEYYFSTVRQYLNNKMSAISTSFSAYASGRVNTLRLWTAKSYDEFDPS